MKVLTNNKYYSEIANVIREQNGTNNTYKPPQMVNALKNLFYEEVEGVPPISFNGIGENLLDYRIDGASGGVGDRTDNLFDGILLDGYYTNNTLTTLTSSAGVYKSLKVNLPAGTYTVVYSEAVLIIRYIELNGDYMTNPAGKSAVESYTFTLNNNSTISLGFRNSTNTQWDDSIKIQVVTGSIVPSKYEPYGYKVPVIISGKNLLPRIATSQTINGVTFTVNDDGSVTCNGTAKRTTQYVFSDNTIYENCVLSGCPSGGGYNNYLLRFRGTGGEQIAETGSGKPISNVEGYVEIRLNTGYTCDNLTFYPMIRLASIQDDTYEPYHEPTTTNIYLDEPIGANESISLSDTNVNIPTIRGTNVLTVDTTVQPSNVYVKSRHESSYETAMRERYEEAQAQLDALESGGE